MSATGIGAPVRRKEDQRFITGKGLYTDDVKLPGMVHAVFVRSPYAHAKINSINTSAAKAMPGVVAIYTGADQAATGVGSVPCGWTLPGLRTAAHPAFGPELFRCFPEARVVVCAVGEQHHAVARADFLVADNVVLVGDADETPDRRIDAHRLLDDGAGIGEG